jgi:hypothetical protein
LDALGFTFGVGETDDLEVRSRGNIVLKPEATQVGGAGSGGEVHIGSAGQPVAVKFFASSFAVEGGAGSLLTEDSLNTITNKSISGATNLLSNIGYASLNLANSIKNSDIASDAAISDSKLATISSAGKVNFSSLTGSPDGVVFPAYTGNSGKYLKLNNGSLEWSTVAAGGVTSVNGQTGDVTVNGYTDSDADIRVSAGIAALKGSANGLASLGSDGKVPSAQLPAAPVTSVNGQTGAVSLSIPTQYTDAMADSRVSAGIAAVKGSANGLASLGSDGKLPTSQLPSLAITSTSVVSSQSAMLALSAEEGDVAIRTDNGKTYILAGDPGTLADWKEVTAGGAVTSVNGQTGNVSLSTTNVSEGSNQYFTDARARTATITDNMSSNPSLAPSATTVTNYVASHIKAFTWNDNTSSQSFIHGFGTKDIIVSVYDIATGEQIYVDSVSALGVGAVLLSASQPAPTTGWRVVVSKI